MLFPAGERFFVRSVRHYVDRVEDPQLKERVKGFFGQEGRHANAHEKHIEVLEAQGYEVRKFLAMYEKIAFGIVEKLAPPELALAATAAAEHYTAIMAEGAFTEHVLDHAHPAMRELLLWHAAEEIEHKDVAFDVLQLVNPSYRLRMAGLAASTVLLVSFWAAGAISLLRQEKIDRKTFRKQMKDMRAHERQPLTKRVFLRGIREYIRRDFHPSDNDNYALAAEYLASVGAA
jgi:hypothetical protein